MKDFMILEERFKEVYVDEVYGWIHKWKRWFMLEEGKLRYKSWFLWNLEYDPKYYDLV